MRGMASNIYLAHNSRTCLVWKGFTETNKRPYTGQQPETKSARGPAYKPLINPGSTAGQPLISFPSVYISGHALHEKVFPGHALHGKGLQRQIARPEPLRP